MGALRRSEERGLCVRHYQPVPLFSRDGLRYVLEVGFLPDCPLSTPCFTTSVSVGFLSVCAPSLCPHELPVGKRLLAAPPPLIFQDGSCAPPHLARSGPSMCQELVTGRWRIATRCQRPLPTAWFTWAGHSASSRCCECRRFLPHFLAPGVQCPRHGLTHSPRL